MKTNCSFEKNLIDSNTVSIKYIVGGWLTFTFCVSGLPSLLNSTRKRQNFVFFFAFRGIVTNIFTNVVLLHPRMRNSSTHVYLLALSFCNIFLLGGILINYSIKSIGKSKSTTNVVSLRTIEKIKECFLSMLTSMNVDDN